VKLGTFSQIPSKVLYYLMSDLWNSTHFWQAEFSPFKASLSLDSYMLPLYKEMAGNSNIYIERYVLFWNFMWCRMVVSYWHSHLQGSRDCLTLKDGAEWLSWNIGTKLPCYTGQNPKSMQIWLTPQHKPYIVCNIHSIKVLVTFPLRKLTTKAI
jgi:hypothetical protein